MSKNKFLNLILSFFVLSLVLFITNPVTVQANPDEEEDKTAFSLYELSDVVSKYLSEATEPQENGGVKGVAGITGDTPMGNMGAFVGYTDESWLQALFSTSATNAAYSSYEKIPLSDGTTTNKIAEYCRYGYILNNLGLDQTGTESSMSIGSFLIGGIMLVAFSLSFFVNVIFSAVLSILQTLNPFALFAVSSNSPFMNDALSETTLPPALEAIGIRLSSLYDFIDGFSWAFIVPIFFAVLVVTLILSRQSNKLSKLKRYLIRIAFIVVGIPLLGSLYTSSLNKMGELLTTGNSASTKLMASTFVDFEAWASNSRLGVPEKARIGTTYTQDGPGVQPSSLALLNTRATAYYINKESGAFGSLDATGLFDTSSTTVEGSTNQWNTNQANASGSTSLAGNVYNVLLRYMAGEFYHSSSYNSKVSAELGLATSATGSTVGGDIYAMFDGSDDVKDYSEGDDFTTRFTDSSKWSGYNIFANGGLIFEQDSQDGITEDWATARGTYKELNDRPSTSIAITDQYGLSTMSMYNYLNTSFGSAMLSVYSSEKASSGFVRRSHKSVTLVGTGMTKPLYYLSTLSMLSCFVVIGFFYAFSIIINNIKRGLKTITSIPFAMLGSIRSIAKVITYTIMMILEVIGSMFVYSLVIEMLTNISAIIEMPIVALMTDVYGFHSIGGMSIVLLVIQIVSIIVYIAFLVMAVRLRKTIVKAMDEAAEEIINKFLDVGNEQSGSKSPGMLGQMGGAALGGAGMAMGQNIANNAIGGGSPEQAMGSSTTKGVSVGGIGNGIEEKSTEDKLTQSTGDKLTGPTGKGDGSSGGSIENNVSSSSGSSTEVGKGKSIVSGESGKQSNAQEKTDSQFASMTGSDGLSATEQERASEIAKAQKKEADKETATAGAKAAVNVGKAVAKGYAGDGAGAAQDGIKAAGNVKDMKDAQQSKSSADVNATNQVKHEKEVKEGSINNEGVTNVDNINNDKIDQSSKVDYKDDAKKNTEQGNGYSNKAFDGSQKGKGRGVADTNTDLSKQREKTTNTSLDKGKANSTDSVNGTSQASKTSQGGQTPTNHFMRQGIGSVQPNNQAVGGSSQTSSNSQSTSVPTDNTIKSPQADTSKNATNLFKQQNDSISKGDIKIPPTS